ncbi:MAG: winged helix-turn-helix domain-containing protein, partial [Aigarchaeota archaeon]|nr:winged helix-turn-helix domain-containing protein [Aigarchaeota archaeon]
MFGLEDLCSVLFELSNQDRLRILHQLDKGAMNVTNLARELGLTVQECSRHVSRLDDVGLTRKDVEGLLHVSPYGRLVLKQLLALKFASRHKDYFATHSLAHLPRESVLRIGDLAASSYMNDISAAFHSVDKMIQEAEEYVWSITDQHLVSTYPLLREAL